MSKNLVEQLFSRQQDIGPEVGAEMDRMAGLGAAELAAALSRRSVRDVRAELAVRQSRQEQSLFGRHEPSAENEKIQEQQELSKDMTRER